MSLFNLENDIPTYKIVKIFDKNNKSATGDVPLILDDELSISVSSKFGELWEAQPNNLMNLLSGAVGLPSGQFELQSAQIWQSTDPIKISFTVNLEMDTDPYKDVIIPTKSLMGLTLPSRGESTIGFEYFNQNLKIKTLIPPGPNLQSLVAEAGVDVENNMIKKLLASWAEGSNGVYTVKLGWVTFNGMIVEKVEPSFSKEMSTSTLKPNKYYPVSASLSIDICSMKMATTNMISDLFE